MKEWDLQEVSCSNREGAQLQLGFVVEEAQGFLPSPSCYGDRTHTGDVD